MQVAILNCSFSQHIAGIIVLASYSFRLRMVVSVRCAAFGASLGISVDATLGNLNLLVASCNFTSNIALQKAGAGFVLVAGSYQNLDVAFNSNRVHNNSGAVGAGGLFCEIAVNRVNTSSCSVTNNMFAFNSAGSQGAAAILQQSAAQANFSMMTVSDNVWTCNSAGKQSRNYVSTIFATMTTARAIRTGARRAHVCVLRLWQHQPF